MANNALIQLQTAATTYSSDILLLNVDGSNQSLAPFLPLSVFNTSSVLSAEMEASLPALGIENLPPLEQLLRSDWLQQNMSQVLNLSMPNLTSILISIQQPSPTQDLSQRMPHTLLVTLTVFYALILVAGVLGNLITCFVISKCKFMHTATNFYLFNLAVSDLILLLSGMPQELYDLWYPNSYPFTDVLCVMESVLSETAANATVLTITAFTVERYIAICHPFRQHTMSKLSRAIKFIFAIWIMALLLALPQAMQFSVVSHGGGFSCTMQNDFFAHVFAVSGFIFFGGPMTAICVLYVLIGVKLKRSRLLQALPRRAYDMHRGISAQGRVIRMLVAVAIAFFLCWAPFHAQRLMAVYGSTAHINSKVFNDIFDILNYTAGVLYFLSTCINPLLYNLMSHKFREAFKVTLSRHFGLGGMYQVQHHNYSALLRQNGSMRHTTVNNNALEHLSSYRVVQLQCRDPSHHLSLQDSIRTTTTTTTINSVGGGGPSGSCRSSNRSRYVLAGSQPNLFHSLSKHDTHTAINSNSGNNENGRSLDRGFCTDRPQRNLQKQISQMSSVSDANSLLETDVNTSHYQPYSSSSYRLRELRHSMAPDHNGSSVQGLKYTDARFLMNSQDWEESNMQLELNDHTSDNETEFYTMTEAPSTSLVTPSTMRATNSQQPVHTVAELNFSQPSRSRIKLSRVINRRDQDPFLVKNNPHVEFMRMHWPTRTTRINHNINHSHSTTQIAKNRIKSPIQKPKKSIENLTDKFRWRTRRKQPVPQIIQNKINNDGNCLRHESSSTVSTTEAPTTSKVLTRISQPTHGARTTTETALVETELSVRNGNLGFGTPKAL